MKRFLHIACAAALLAVVALPAAAGGPGKGDHDPANDGQRNPYHQRYQAWDSSFPQWPAGRYGRFCREIGWHGYQQPGWSYDHDAPRYLSERAIERCVMQQRFYGISKIKFGDGRYTVHARDAHGRKVKVDVDARSGRILGVRPR